MGSIPCSAHNQQFFCEWPNLYLISFVNLNITFWFLFNYSIRVCQTCPMGAIFLCVAKFLLN
jgi:hypothetical protein